MCGISGVFGSLSGNATAIVNAMNDIIAYRGPDGQGIWLEGRVVFGHRRLSIVDLTEAGAQPMHYRDRYVITYNGEIYNYVELRQELETLGHVFHSGTDTEVILAAYAEWGEACLQRFNGMWAFAIFDRGAGQLFLARDRFGVKPLYLWQSPQGFVAFASEIKQFTVLPGWQARLNHQRAYDFLAWAALDHTEETLFAGVRQLRGGQCLRLHVSEMDTTGGVAALPVRTWYSLPVAPFAGDAAAAVTQFRALLEDAVRLRLRADVPVGSCLSGGLDSSSIVCLMSRLLQQESANNQQKTFTYRDALQRYDEWQFAEAIVTTTGVEACQIYASSGGIFDVLDQLIWHQDEPFSTTSIYAQWRVFENAADSRVTVMLDGQGADELLAGYRTFIGPYLGRLLRSGRWVQLISEANAIAKVQGLPLLRLLLILGDTLLPEGMRRILRGLLGRSMAPGWLALSKLKADVSDPFRSVASAHLSLTGQSRAQLTATNLQMLLHWEDRNSMAHSIEARVPFLDYRLVEFALGLPDEMKLSSGFTKHVLREAMKGRVPEAVRMRTDKMGFITAEEVWVRQDYSDAFRQALREAVNAAQGILRPAVLDELEEIIAGTRPFSSVLWRQICFGLWMKKFSVAL